MPRRRPSRRPSLKHRRLAIFTSRARRPCPKTSFKLSSRSPCLRSSRHLSLLAHTETEHSVQSNAAWGSARRALLTMGQNNGKRQRNFDPSVSANPMLTMPTKYHLDHLTRTARTAGAHSHRFPPITSARTRTCTMLLGHNKAEYHGDLKRTHTTSWTRTCHHTASRLRLPRVQFSRRTTTTRGL